MEENQTNFNETFTPSPPLFTLPLTTLIYFLYNFIFLAALLGNSLTIYTILSSPRMRSVTNYLICNLAFSDFLMALLCIPFSYTSIVHQYWPFGLILCHIVSPAQATCVFVSSYTLIVLAIDRYVAILYPLRPRLRRSQAIALIILVWIVALVTASPIAAFTRLEEEDRPLCVESAWSSPDLKLIYSLALLTLQYFLPIMVLIFTYTRIAIAVWGKKAPGEAEDGRDARLKRAKRKMIKMMLTVVIIYTISWLPFNVYSIILDHFPSVVEPPSNLNLTFSNETFWIPPEDDPAFQHTKTLALLYLTFHLLALSHTVCNPIIYCGMNSRFRSGFAQATRRIPCVSKLFQRDGDVMNVEMRFRLQLQRSGTCTTTFTFSQQQNQLQTRSVPGRHYKTMGTKNGRADPRIEESFI